MKHRFLVLAACLSTAAQSQTQITEGVFGGNIHLTDTVGANIGKGGHLDEYFWRPISVGKDYMVQLNSKWMRYGGIDVEKDFDINDRGAINSKFDQSVADYVAKAKYCRRYNIEPMFTLPMDTSQDFGPGLTTFNQMAGEAAQMVKQVNTALYNQNIDPVRWWVYSNEPEDGGSLHLYDDTWAAEKIWRYTKLLHDSVVDNWDYADWDTVRFVGPELFAYDNWNHGTGKVNRLVDQLTGFWSPFTTAHPDTFSILPYLDIFSFHIYPTGDQHNTGSGDFVKATKQNVIDYARVGSVQANNNQIASLEDNLIELNSRLATYNTANNKKIKGAITEANICHINAIGGNAQVPEAADTSQFGTSANSFIAGQWLAEVMAVCMDQNTDFDFWSGLEGSSGSTPPYKNDIGFLYGNSAVRGARKSTYWHFKLLADNFRGNFYWGSHNQNGVTPAPTFAGNGIKVLAAAQPAGFKIMIMNHNDDDYQYRVNMTATGDTPGRVTINFDPSMVTGFPIAANKYKDMDSLLKRHSTVLLTFDCHGDLWERKEYTEEDNDKGRAPHLRQVGNVYVEPSTIACTLPGGIGGEITEGTEFKYDTVVVNEDLILTAGNTLTFDHCLVIMSPGKKIIAQSETRLEILNTGIVGCDGEQWGGIEVQGAHLNEQVIMNNAYLINADFPLLAQSVSMIDIQQSVMVGGHTAVMLEGCDEFHVDQSIIACFTDGISTSNTTGNFNSTINMNKIWDVDNAMVFNSDTHDKLNISCNQMTFRERGILSRSSTINDQGTSMVSAGNSFYNSLSLEPMGYIDNEPTSFVYNYGPSQSAEFTYPEVVLSDVSTNEAFADPLCTYFYVHDCPAWIPTDIKDHPTVNNPGMTVYPNPSSGAFTLKYQDARGIYNMSIYDMMGRVIESREVNLDSNSEINFDIKSRGLYIVTLQNENNRLAQKIIVD